jgi:protein-S-isoprenylcysteine O-methyltransferase Ste14
VLLSFVVLDDLMPAIGLTTTVVEMKRMDKQLVAAKKENAQIMVCIVVVVVVVVVVIAVF